MSAHQQDGSLPDVRRARSQGLGDVLHRTAARLPGKPALVHGDVRLSYAELDATVNRTAHALAARGLAKGDRLALLSHNCWQFVVLSFATAKLGVLLVPVNFMLGKDEVAFILEHSGRRRWSRRTPCCRSRRLPSRGSTSRCAASCGSPAATSPTAGRTSTAGRRTGRRTPPTCWSTTTTRCGLMYTSGTESRPKGAVLTSRSLLAQYVSCIVDGGMTADDVEVHSLPMYHCAQLDCFLGPTSTWGDERHPARARPGRAPGDDRAGAGHEAVLPSDGVDLVAAPPGLRHP
jgi:fatty-acyl-CoA synthase